LKFGELNIHIMFGQQVLRGLIANTTEL